MIKKILIVSLFILPVFAAMTNHPIGNFISVIWGGIGWLLLFSELGITITPKKEQTPLERTL